MKARMKKFLIGFLVLFLLGVIVLVGLLIYFLTFDKCKGSDCKVKVECNTFGTELITEDGQCQCKINFIGMECDICKEGYVGDDCNQSTCGTLGTKGKEVDGTVCVCHTGFKGDKCDLCDQGYTGTNCNDCIDGYSKSHNESCMANSSSDENKEPSLNDCNVVGTKETNGSSCICNDRFVGTKCDQCIKPFIGTHCDQCISGYNGSLCNECAEGYDKRGNRCLEIKQCYLNGTAEIAKEGCICKPGYTGDKCYDCDLRYEMKERFSLCECQPEFRGPNCEWCNHGYYKEDNGTCVEGICNPIGIQYQLPDGTCVCHHKYKGPKCDICQDGFHKNNGLCLEGSCHISGTHSRMVDGTCICKPKWQGDRCNNCKLGYSGSNCDQCGSEFHSDGQTCVEGTCDTNGTESRTTNGACICKSTFTGPQCTQCEVGYRGKACDLCTEEYHREFSQCIEGGCGFPGTKTRSSNGTCTCNTGYVGPKCECDAKYTKLVDQKLRCICFNDNVKEGNCDGCKDGFISNHSICDWCDEGYHATLKYECPDCPGGSKLVEKQCIGMYFICYFFKHLYVPELPKCNLGQLYSQITFSSYFVKKLHFCDALFNFCSIFVTICLTMLTSLFLNGPTSLKIVGVVGVLKTLVKGTFNVTL